MSESKTVLRMSPSGDWTPVHMESPAELPPLASELLAGVNDIERELVASLAPVESLLPPPERELLRQRICEALNDSMTVTAKIISQARTDKPASEERTGVYDDATRGYDNSVYGPDPEQVLVCDASVADADGNFPPLAE